MKNLMLTLMAILVFGVISATLDAGSTLAASPAEIISGSACYHLTNTGLPTAGCTSSNKLDSNGGYLSTLLSGIIFLAGFLSVLFLIIGSARFVTATGDPKRIQSAKNTVIYSITGLIVVILAQVIIGFVIGSL